MKKLIVLAVLAIIIQDARSQFFGQSFASSSYTDSTGKVISKKVFTDSTGRKVVEEIPAITNELLPPLLPINHLPDTLIEKPTPLKPVIVPPAIQVQPPPPVRVITTFPQRTSTQKPQFKSQNNNLQQSYNDGKGNGAYKANGENGAYRVKGDDGTYRPKGNLGTYVHTNQGAYKPDDRGKYRGF